MRQGCAAPCTIETGFAAFHLNLEFGPDTRFQVHVRLIFFGGFLPRLGEAKVRVRTVLDGVIPPDLIVGPAVGRSEIDVLVTSIALNAERDADESAGGAVGTRGRLAGQVDFDRAVTK